MKCLPAIIGIVCASTVSLAAMVCAVLLEFHAGTTPAWLGAVAASGTTVVLAIVQLVFVRNGGMSDGGGGDGVLPGMRGRSSPDGGDSSIRPEKLQD
jgi:hypothetical protein